MSHLGHKPFHGRQVYKWMYKHLADRFDQMTDLKKDLRALLEERFFISIPQVPARERSVDGTEKFLF